MQDVSKHRENLEGSVPGRCEEHSGSFVYLEDGPCFIEGSATGNGARIDDGGGQANHVARPATPRAQAARIASESGIGGA